MRKGPTSVPRRSAISAAASVASNRMRCARARKVWPSSVSDNLRVVRWTSLVPSARSSSASLSLTTDLALPSRRAAALIDPASAMATKAAMPSSFIIVRISRKPVSAFPG